MTRAEAWARVKNASNSSHNICLYLRRVCENPYDFPLFIASELLKLN